MTPLLEKPIYSPFWGLLILTWALGIWLIVHIISLERQSKSLSVGLGEILPESRLALETQKRYVSLVQDLQQTAISDPQADRIVTEFKLKQRSQAPKAK